MTRRLALCPWCPGWESYHSPVLITRKLFIPRTADRTKTPETLVGHTRDTHGGRTEGDELCATEHHSNGHVMEEV
jgi:hypothetical protein